MSFDDLDLKEQLLRGIYAYGFENPSKIQQMAIPEVISGVDVIAQSQSGTGKTGTFCISALEKVNTNSKHSQILILAPTRELATQICKVCAALGNYITNLNIYI